MRKLIVNKKEIRSFGRIGKINLIKFITIKYLFFIITNIAKKHSSEQFQDIMIYAIPKPINYKINMFAV